MFELYQSSNEGEKYPEECLGHFNSPNELIRKFGFSKEEIKQLLEENYVRGRYHLKFDTKFMRDLALDALIEDSISTLSIDDISKHLGISFNAANLALFKAIKKIKKSGRAMQFANAVAELQSIRKNRLPEFYEKRTMREVVGDYEVITNTTIKVSASDVPSLN